MSYKNSTTEEIIDTVVIDEEIDEKDFWTLNIPKPRLPKFKKPSPKAIAIGAGVAVTGLAAAFLASLEDESSSTHKILDYDAENQTLALSPAIVDNIEDIPVSDETIDIVDNSED